MSVFCDSISELLANVQNHSEQVPLPDLQDLISKCTNPAISSILRTNSAVACYLSGRVHEAIQELEKSVENNPLNYASYFDLFSLLFAVRKHEEALKNLVCGLSCLYLLRGQKPDKEADINKAIQYCENNMEARLLKGMHYFQKSKYSLALNEINWVLEIQPHNVKFRTIKAGILRILSSKAHHEHHEEPDRLLESSFPAFDEVPRRFQCTLYEQEQLQALNIVDEIGKKLAEFNELFAELNAEQVSLVQRNPTIYLIGRNPKHSKGAGHKELFSSSLMIEEEQEEVNCSGLEPVLNPKASARKPKEDSGFIESISLSDMRTPAWQEKKEQFSSLASGCVMNSDNQSFSRTLQSGLPESSSYTLHVLEDDKNLSIKVHKIELTELPQQEREKLINLYCLFEYGDRQFNTDGFGGDQSIDQSFETELEDEPQVLILSLFNKEIHAFKDRLVGTGSKEIVTTGRIEVPIYRDSEKTESVGRVLLDVRYK